MSAGSGSPKGKARNTLCALNRAHSQTTCCRVARTSQCGQSGKVVRFTLKKKLHVHATFNRVRLKTLIYSTVYTCCNVHSYLVTRAGVPVPEGRCDARVGRREPGSVRLQEPHLGRLRRSRQHTFQGTRFCARSSRRLLHAGDCVTTEHCEYACVHE